MKEREFMRTRARAHLLEPGGDGVSMGRIRIELTPRQAQTLCDVVQGTGLPRHTVILEALSLLRWAAREIREGRCIA